MNWYRIVTSEVPEEDIGFVKDFRGLRINVEHPAGTDRVGVDPEGAEWRVRMKYDYGFIASEQGEDGMALDVYMGPNEEADTVFVVEQLKPYDNGAFDEHKIMLGFDTEEQAKSAYLHHYDRDDFLGEVTTMSFSDFKNQIESSKPLELPKKAITWYQKLKLAQIQGEWWIDDSGSAIYADGDVGEYNHESYVISTVLGKYDLDFEGSGVDLSTPQGLEEYVNNNWQDVVEHAVLQGTITAEQGHVAANNPDAEFDAGETFRELLVGEFTSMDALIVAGATPEEVEIGSGGGDARLFAQKNWGWSRVQGNNVETWNASPGRLQNIATGLYDAYNESVEGATFNLYLESTKKWYQEVPYEDLSEGNVGALRRNEFVGWG